LDNGNTEQEVEKEEVEDVPQRPVVFPAADTPPSGLPAAYPYNRPEWNALFPFKSKLKWDFCLTHVEENSGRVFLDCIIHSGLFKEGSNVKSGDHLRELIHAMTDGLDCEYKKNTIDIEGVKVKY
jgi:hypothetical protein